MAGSRQNSLPRTPSLPTRPFSLSQTRISPDSSFAATKRRKADTERLSRSACFRNVFRVRSSKATLVFFCRSFLASGSITDCDGIRVGAGIRHYEKLVTFTPPPETFIDGLWFAGRAGFHVIAKKTHGGSLN